MKKCLAFLCVLLAAALCSCDIQQNETSVSQSESQIASPSAEPSVSPMTTPHSAPHAEPSASPNAAPDASLSMISFIPKREAIDQILQQIYHDDPDILATFDFIKTKCFYGYEGNMRDYGNYYVTMILECYERYVREVPGFYIFWFHEQHYGDDGHEHSITSNEYLVNVVTGEIIAERIYLPDGKYIYNDEFESLYYK